MKRSLLALLLTLVMCLSLFCTACSSSKDSDENGEDSKLLKTESEVTAVTITLYAPTDGSTTQEQVEIVQEAFNEITQAKYNTNVVLKLIPEDEYESVVDSTLEAQKAQAEAEAELILEENETEEPLPEGEYPEVKDNQIDIFMVQTFERFYQLAYGEDGDGYLYPLDEDLAETAKLLDSYVYPYLLRSAKVDGETFGIFNNTIFGDYEYLLLNKELVDKYKFDPENMKDLLSIAIFLEDVKNNEPDYIPFLGDIEAPVVYWNDTKSIIGAYLGSSLTSSGTVNAVSYKPSHLNPGNLFASTDYQAWITEYNTLNRQEIFVEKTEENADAKFAATIIKGDVTLSPTYAKEYGNYKEDQFGFKYVTIDGVDYYCSVYRRPLADNKNVFAAGYVVSAYAENPTRCMEILTCLNTDAQLANTFMYGKKDVHYTIDEETKLVKKTTDSYSMDIQHIGNMFLITPSEDMMNDPYWSFMCSDNWKNAKNTNREAVMSPFLGFYYDPPKPEPELDENGDEIPLALDIDATFDEVMAKIIEMSPAYFEKAINFVPTAEINMQSFIRSLQVEHSKDPYIKALTSSEAKYYYIIGPYREWYQTHYNTTIDLG